MKLFCKNMSFLLAVNAPQTFGGVILIKRGGGQIFVDLLTRLVGGFNPSKKYAHRIGSFPQASGWK